MATAAGLDAGLLIGAEDVVLGPQGYALPQARIEVQHRAGLVGDVGITGKNPVLVYRQGLMAAVARIRHTVLRLIGVPSTVRTRAVTSARDWRLSGCWVSATSSQATALTRA